MNQETMHKEPSRVQRVLSRAVASPYFWILLIGVMFVGPILRTLQVQGPPPVSKLGQVNDFELIDQSNDAFSSAELRGRIWVASMICGQCPHVNPEQLEVLSKIRGKTKNMVDAFRLVSFTLDSQQDRPDQLDEIERPYGLSKRWILLTAPEENNDVIDRVLDNVYSHDESHRLAERSQAEDELPPRLTHMIALIDRDFCVRAYYDLRSPDVLKHLMRGINNVLHAQSDGAQCPTISP